MSESRYFPWAEGQSTKPDVEALLKAFPPETLVIGAAVSYEQIRSVIGRSAGNRFRTVCNAWIKRLHRDHGINISCEDNVGFYVPTFIQVAAETKPAIRHIGRTARKQTRRLAASKPENEHQRLTQDHQGKLMNVFDRESRKARMNTLPGTAVKEMPKISAPVEKQRQ